MTGQLFEIVIRATGEVRDADGNLISSEPIESRMTLTRDQLDELGIDPPHRTGVGP